MPDKVPQYGTVAPQNLYLYNYNIDVKILADVNILKKKS
jgi:hypothetical protein